MFPSVNPGVVAGDMLVSYWPIFSLSLATVLVSQKSLRKFTRASFLLGFD